MAPKNRWHLNFVEDAKENGHDWAEGVDRVWHNVVCPRCDGEGTTWHGLSFAAEDFAEDREGLTEAIEAGAFDRPCEECHGNKVMSALDIQAMPHEIQQEYLRWETEAINLARADAQERMMGA